MCVMLNNITNIWFFEGQSIFLRYMIGIKNKYNLGKSCIVLITSKNFSEEWDNGEMKIMLCQE